METKTSPENSPENCSICFDELKDGTYTLSCNHIYHKECIKTWLSNHTTCPLCRANVEPIEQYVEDNVVTPHRLLELRELRMLTELGGYGLESIGSLFSSRVKGLGHCISRQVRNGTYDTSLGESSWWSFIVTVVLTVIVHVCTRT
jgi:hypothetical protein